MAGIYKIIFALVVVYVALVFAKPYEFYDDDNLMILEDGTYSKRATDCGSGSEPEGSYSRKCRSSCKTGERHISMYDNKCSGKKCCMCHSRWGYGSGCSVDFGK